MMVKLLRISKSFGAVRALHNVDLELQPGELLGLVGDNAAGKSTLMKILSGALMPDEGEIFLQDEKVHFSSPLDARRFGIEMIYQDLALIDSFDVPANMFLGSEIATRILDGLIEILRKKKMEQKAKKVLSELDIYVDSMKVEAKDLSGGQRQSIAVGRAMMFEPKVLIMDEPTANLSPNKIKILLELMKRTKEKGVAVIFISHRLQDVFSVADRIMVLKGGYKVGDRRVGAITIDEVVAMMVGALSDY
jgi:ABC-type sugar transport system ATPase subunit